MVFVRAGSQAQQSGLGTGPSFGPAGEASSAQAVGVSPVATPVPSVPQVVPDVPPTTSGVLAARRKSGQASNLARLLTPEEKEIRRARRNLITASVCVIVLVIVLAVLLQL